MSGMDDWGNWFIEDIETSLRQLLLPDVILRLAFLHMTPRRKAEIYGPAIKAFAHAAAFSRSTGVGPDFYSEVVTIALPIADHFITQMQRFTGKDREHLLSEERRQLHECAEGTDAKQKVDMILSLAETLADAAICHGRSTFQIFSEYDRMVEEAFEALEKTHLN